VIITHFKLLPWHSPGGTEESHEKSLAE